MTTKGRELRGSTFHGVRGHVSSASVISTSGVLGLTRGIIVLVALWMLGSDLVLANEITVSYIPVFV